MHDILNEAAYLEGFLREYVLCKGQLISECPFGVKTSSIIPTKLFLDFCPEIFVASLGLPGSPMGLPVGFLIYDFTY